MLPVTEGLCADGAGKNFDGLAAELSSGYQKSSLNYGSIYNLTTNAVTQGTVSSANVTKAPAIIGLSYGFRVADRFVASVGGNINLLSTDLSGQCVVCADTITEKVRNRASVFIAPGYEISPDGVAFVKFGYTHISTSVSATSGTAISGGPKTGGWLGGVGYKQFLTDQIYGFAELNYSKNSSGQITAPEGPVYVNTGDLKTTSALVGLGYKF